MLDPNHYEHARTISVTDSNKWVTIKDAAEYCQCSTKTIRRWITLGHIEAQRFGPRLIRVNTASLDNLGRSLSYAA